MMEDQDRSSPGISGPGFLAMFFIACLCGWGAIYLGWSVIDAMDTGKLCVGGRRGCYSWEYDYWNMWWAVAERAFGAFLFGSIALGCAAGAWQYMKAD